MTIEFDPMEGLLPQGQHDFVVKLASERKTKNGDDMLMVAMDVWDKKGKAHEIRDYFVLTSNWMHKLKRFCKSIGRESDFDAGKLETESYAGLKGILETKQEYDENYGAQNKVSKYLEKKEQADEDKDLDQDVPF